MSSLVPLPIPSGGGLAPTTQRSETPASGQRKTDRLIEIRYRSEAFKAAMEAASEATHEADSIGERLLTLVLTVSDTRPENWIDRFRRIGCRNFGLLQLVTSTAPAKDRKDTSSSVKAGNGIHAGNP